MNDEPTVRHDLRPGDIGRIVTLHGELYDAVDGFGLRFEAFVGQTLAEFVLENDATGKLWLLERDDKLVGCTAAVLRDDADQRRGQIRWVVLDPNERGQGIGKKLVMDAIQYCRDKHCHSVYLETTDNLKASQSLYEKLGFVITSSTIAEAWDGPRPLIFMELKLT